VGMNFQVKENDRRDPLFLGYYLASPITIGPVPVIVDVVTDAVLIKWELL
jgi:hypothetical protein